LFTTPNGWLKMLLRDHTELVGTLHEITNAAFQWPLFKISVKSDGGEKCGLTRNG